MCAKRAKENKTAWFRGTKRKSFSVAESAKQHSIAMENLGAAVGQVAIRLLCLRV